VNEEKNAARERAIQIKTRGVKNAYKLARTKRLFRKKARQLDEEALIEIERQRSIQGSCKFYKLLNDVRRPFEPQVVVCRAKNGELLTTKNQVLARFLQSSHLSRQTKFTIHKTLIRPVLLYGSETWTLTKTDENQLLVFKRKVLRTICGPKIENGVYRRRYNHELEKECDSPNALNVTKTSRLRYDGHMIRRLEDLPKKNSIQKQTQKKEKSRKTEIQAGGCTVLKTGSL
jgi:hypothetical protein